MSRFNPHFPNAAKVFEAAQEFKRRCLIRKGSLFLDGIELWTTQHFQALIDNFVNSPDEGHGSFYEKLEGQLGACDPLDVALMAEVFWIVQLGPNNFGPDRKRERLEQIWNIKPAASFPKDSQFLTKDVLSGLGSAGQAYTQRMWMEIAFAIRIFKAFVEKPQEDRELVLSNGESFSTWLNSERGAERRQFYHALCHVLFPDEFERIFSANHKEKVAHEHSLWIPQYKGDWAALDEGLLRLRHRLEKKHPGSGVDYYIPPVGTLMDDAEDNDQPDLSDVRDSDVPGHFIERSPRDARTADNIIYFGPPGTGKTHKLQLAMRAASTAAEQFLFVSFHPSYSYEDFIGGLRPVVAADGKSVAITYQKGPFLTLCDLAHASPAKRFTLFIDEINRANIAKVFGELITLIEPSKRVRAGSKPGSDDLGLWVTVPGLSEPFGVPDNVDLVATMNTADRSIAMMDVALRRRFRFEECAPLPDTIEPATVGNINLVRLLKSINQRLEYLLDHDHLIGHAYFMRIGNLADLQKVLAERIVPLLQEYFFEDLAKVRLVLTGGDRDNAFFTSRALDPTKLFPDGRQAVGLESRHAFAMGNPSLWSEAAIISLYSQNDAVADFTSASPVTISGT